MPRAIAEGKVRPTANREVSKAGTSIARTGVSPQGGRHVGVRARVRAPPMMVMMVRMVSDGDDADHGDDGDNDSDNENDVADDADGDD